MNDDASRQDLRHDLCGLGRLMATVEAADGGEFRILHHGNPLFLIFSYPRILRPSPFRLEEQYRFSLFIVVVEE